MAALSSELLRADTGSVKFSISAATLSRIVDIAKHASPARATMVAHSAVLIEARAGEVLATGSDRDTTVVARGGAVIEVVGEVLVHPRPLSEFLRTVSGDAVLEVVDEGDGDLSVSIDSGSPYRFRTVATTFPKPPRPQGTPSSVDLGDLKDGLSAVRSSVDGSGVVQLVSSDTELHLNTTDSYRLSQAVLPGAGWGDFTGLVPLGVLDWVSQGGCDEVLVDPKGRLIEFSSPEASYGARLSPAPFPAIDSVLSNLPSSRVILPLAQVKAALVRLGAIADVEPLSCKLSGKTITMAVESSPLGSGEEEVQTSGVADDFEFSVNLTYLREALNSRAGDSLELAYTSPLNPLFFISHEPLSITTAVMPIRK